MDSDTCKTTKIQPVKAAPIPDNINEILTDAQHRSLARLKLQGWGIAFVRQSKHLPPIVVIFSDDKQDHAVLLDNGEVDHPVDLRLRAEDQQYRSSFYQVA